MKVDVWPLMLSLAAAALTGGCATPVQPAAKAKQSGNATASMLTGSAGVRAAAIAKQGTRPIIHRRPRRPIKHRSEESCHELVERNPISRCLDVPIIMVTPVIVDRIEVGKEQPHHRMCFLLFYD